MLLSFFLLKTFLLLRKYLVFGHLQHPALGFLVVEGVAELLGLGPQRRPSLDLLVNHVLQLLTVGWKRQFDVFFYRDFKLKC